MFDQIYAIVQHYFPDVAPPSGDQVYVRCPFHKGGEERRPSLSINLTNGMWNCKAGCGAGGIGWLLHLMGLSREQVDATTKHISDELKQNQETKKIQGAHFTAARDPFRTDCILPEAMLGLYDHPPEKLLQKGFSPQLLQQFDVGYDPQLKRITYPIRDLYGHLAGLSGGATEPWQQPKYKVYEGGRRTAVGQRTRGDFGEWFDRDFPDYRFSNHAVLWNYDRVYPTVADLRPRQGELYIVEGFKACLWMIQSGFLPTVALMGSSMSEYQKRLIQRFGGTIYLCLDNDRAGRSGADKIYKALWPSAVGRIRMMAYPSADENTQPDDYSETELREFITRSVSYIPSTPRNSFRDSPRS